MKRILAGALSLCLLFSLAACNIPSPEQQLTDAIVKQQKSVSMLATDVTELFQKVFAARPELQVYLKSMSAKSEGLKVLIELEYDHPNIPVGEIAVGKSDEILASALTKSLTEAKSEGAMVLLGESEQPEAQSVIDRIRQQDYLASMGMDATEWVFSSNDFTKDMIVYYTIDYIDGKEEILSARQKVADKVDALAKTLWSESDFPEIRVRAIHDYLVKNAEYVDSDSVLRDHTAYGVLIDGKGVCDSYTYAAHLLLQKAGVESVLANGTYDGTEHAWNVVKLGENWYHIDVTWDDPVGAPAGYTTYEYYLKGDATMKKDHEWTMKLPSCPADWKE